VFYELAAQPGTPRRFWNDGEDEAC
jgi:hypothetical protein